MIKTVKKAVAGAITAAMMLTAMPTFATGPMVYVKADTMTNEEAAQGSYYVRQKGAYYPVTVTGEAGTVYVDADGDYYEEAEVSDKWIGKNGMEYTAKSCYVTETLKTYTRSTKKVGDVQFFRYVNDENSSDRTCAALSAKLARAKFKKASEFHCSGAPKTGAKQDDPYYVAAVYTGVSEKQDYCYTYSCGGDTIEIAWGADEKTPFPLYQYKEGEEVSGTFTVASLNVDGLPQKLLGISINGDGPGAAGTVELSKAVAQRNWDIFAVSENFNYNNNLMSGLKDKYDAGTYGGKITGLTNKTDGLNLIWKKQFSVADEKRTKWETSYSTGIFNTGNGADGMISKGFRYYAVTLEEGVTVDVYITHMDADSAQGDIDAREAQLRQLVKAIKKSSTGNPIIFMGDTNSRYTRERLKELFIDELNSDDRFEVKDPWVETAWDGVYPTYGADSIMAEDKGGPYPYPQAEIVDKMFVINNNESNVKLTINSYTVDNTLVREDGTALADHWPIVVELGYTAVR